MNTLGRKKLERNPSIMELATLSNGSRTSVAKASENSDERHSQRHQEVSEMFSDTVREVEELLNEAISIARRASEEPQSTSKAGQDSAKNGHLRRKAKISFGNSPVIRLPSLPHVASYPSIASTQRDFISRDQSSQQKPTKALNSGEEIPLQSKHPPPSVPAPAATPLREQEDLLSRRTSLRRALTMGGDIRDYVKVYEPPQAQKRPASSRRERRARRKLAPLTEDADAHTQARNLNAPGDEGFSDVYWEEKGPLLDPYLSKDEPDPSDFISPKLQNQRPRHRFKSRMEKFDLRNRRHIDVEATGDLSATRTSHRQPIARDWRTSRKRSAAAIACLNTAMLGIVIGIYAGEVPAIQYALADMHHYAILGNVFLYLGLAIPTIFLWPLPLLHGRKPYTVLALSVALPLQIPQGVAVGAFRSPEVPTYRAVLLLSRGLSGFALGFAAINFKTTLLDVFGASLQSGNPHQEVVSAYDVRRHGGGMGVWLGVWSWCAMGSIALGFLIGALVTGGANVTWGFWISLFLMTCTLLLNVVAPETRRARHRRTATEVWTGTGKWKRIARGEIKMHLVARGPLWWGEEVKWGWEMSRRMLAQPGFAVLALYVSWVYAQFTLIMMLLGALVSKYYRFRPGLVGVCVAALAFGAIIATPFQTASFFSRARHHGPRTDSMTFETQVRCSSHLIRRLVFMTFLPLSAVTSTVTSSGPPIPAAIPSLAAGLVGFLSNLAVAECNGLIMETFDTSDLHGSRTGNTLDEKAEDYRRQTAKYTSYPRVSAGFAVSQGLGYLLAAAATGTGGAIERHLGAEQAAAVVAGVLMGLTILLTGVLVRYKTVRMVPSRRPSMDLHGRRRSTREPVIIGNPSGMTRRVNILELGSQTRWSEIRRINRLQDMNMITGG